MSDKPEIRTKFLDYDARRRPKTQFSCVKCEKDLDPKKPWRTVHLVNGGPFVLHSEDEAIYDRNDPGDGGSHAIGNDCARQLGLEWTHPPKLITQPEHPIPENTLENEKTHSSARLQTARSSAGRLRRVEGA